MESLDNTRDKADLNLQQFLAEIKDENKEYLFTEQIDECSLDGTGHMIQSHRCDCSGAFCANDEENFSASTEEDDAL